MDARPPAAQRRCTPIAAVLVLLSIISVVPGEVQAGSATWSAIPISSDWNTFANWSTLMVPNGPSDTATFAKSLQTTVSLSASVEVDGIHFSQGANPYTISNSAQNDLKLSGDGVVNDSGSLQNFDVPSDSAIEFVNAATAGTNTRFNSHGGSQTSVAGALIAFRGSANAGGGDFINRGGSAAGAFGSSIEFRDISSAENGSFAVLSATANSAQDATITFMESSTAAKASFELPGGHMQFRHSSSAGNGSFTVLASANSAQDPTITFIETATAARGSFELAGGRMQFLDASHAENAGVTIHGGSAGFQRGELLFAGVAIADRAGIIARGGTAHNLSGGKLVFTANSSAANAVLLAVGGTDGGFGGSVEFSGYSRGDKASITLGGNGWLKIAHHEQRGITMGSLNGDGTVYLGSKELTVGNSGHSMVFRGVISDGEPGAGGSNVGGSLVKMGASTLQLSGANTYTGGTIVGEGRLLVNNQFGSATGAGPVTLTGPRTVLSGNGKISGPVVIPAGATLSPGDVFTARGSLEIGNDLTLQGGSTLQLGLDGTRDHTTLRRSGGTWVFAPNQAFSILDINVQLGTYENVITGLAGDPGGTATWTITTPSFAGKFVYDGAGNIDLTLTEIPGKPLATPTPSGTPGVTPQPTPSPTGPPSTTPTATPTVLGNIATRLRVGTGENVLIAGFIVTGDQPKRLMLRAIAPSLQLDGKLQDPVLELYDNIGELIRANDNWQAAPNKQEIIDSTIAPRHELESAILVTLPASNSAYTAVVRGANGATGVGVVEGYDLDQSVNSKLANISTRGLVQTGENVMIGGFFVLNGTQKVIVRALGPSLPVDGHLANTTLDLISSNGDLIAFNDDWRDTQQEQIEATAVPPSNQFESAIVATLPAGFYTAVVRGASNNSGVALVEVYALD